MNLRERCDRCKSYVTTLGLLGGIRTFISEEKAQLGIGGALIAIMIAVIIGVGVVIPVITNVTESAGLTGTTATIVELMPLFVALVLLVAIVGLISR